jgi:hypothetical protein
VYGRDFFPTSEIPAPARRGLGGGYNRPLLWSGAIDPSRWIDEALGLILHDVTLESARATKTTDRRSRSWRR